jgi:hypothetical protein
MSELERLLHSLASLQDAIDRVEVDVDITRAQNSALMEAVIYYAEGRYDGGETARKALEVIRATS